MIRGKVREGIREYLEDPENAAFFHSIEGSEELLDLIMNDDDFLDAMIDGSKTIDKGAFGTPTADGITQYIDQFLDHVTGNGNSFNRLLAEWKADPSKMEPVLAAARIGEIPVGSPESVAADFGNAVAANDVANTFSSGVSQEASMDYTSVEVDFERDIVGQGAYHFAFTNDEGVSLLSGMRFDIQLIDPATNQIFASSSAIGQPESQGLMNDGSGSIEIDTPSLFGR